MKKDKINGFAMIEILIAAVTVVTIFALLYRSVYPLVGSFRETERYDDIDSKYVAFYLKEMLETDSYNYRADWASVRGSIPYKKYHTYAYSDNNSTTPINTPTGNTHYIYKNEICNNLTEANNVKNNQYFCNTYITAARVTDIYVTAYSTTLYGFKNYITRTHKNQFNRSFRNYVNYMPSYSKNSSKSTNNNYYRIIVEIEHDSYNTAKETYYTYSTIEVVAR